MQQALLRLQASLLRERLTAIDAMTLRRFKTWLLPLCAACLLLASWMMYHSLSGGQMAGCGAGSGCDSVMSSPWAYLLGGVPVSLPAAVVYALLILCLLFLGGESAEARSLDKLLWILLPLFGGCIVGAALWFCYLQLAVLHAFCKYCTLMHLLGCVAAAVIFVQAGKQGHRPLVPFVCGLAAAAAFAFVQSCTLPDAIYDSGSAEASLPLFTEEELPVITASSQPEANPTTITLLFDFQCNHCRRLHRILPEMLEKAGGSYRILLCPVPLSSACNPYIPYSGTDRFAGSCQLTRYALAVWFARPEAYADYWDYLLGSGDERTAVTPADAAAQARVILGESFDAALADARIDACISKAEELFGRTSSLGKSGVPRLICGSRWLVPETDDADELLTLIGSEL